MDFYIAKPFVQILAALPRCELSIRECIRLFVYNGAVKDVKEVIVPTRFMA